MVIIEACGDEVNESSQGYYALLPKKTQLMGVSATEPPFSGSGGTIGTTPKKKLN
jgi:hypothetical protein